MNHVKFETATRLKEAGFPQPEPQAWQPYWAYGDLCIISMVYADGDVDLIRPVMREIGFTKDQFIRLATFAPTIEDIMPRLPKYCILQYWAGQPSCSFQDDEHPMRTVGESFTEAAANMWLDWKALQR